MQSVGLVHPTMVLMAPNQCRTKTLFRVMCKQWPVSYCNRIISSLLFLENLWASQSLPGHHYIGLIEDCHSSSFLSIIFLWILVTVSLFSFLLSILPWKDINFELGLLGLCVCLFVFLQLFSYYRLRGSLWTIPTTSKPREPEKQKGDFLWNDHVQEIWCEKKRKSQYAKSHWLTSTWSACSVYLRGTIRHNGRRVSIPCYLLV